MRFRAYYCDESGQLTMGYVDVIDNVVYSQTGRPIEHDGETVELRGWPDAEAQSCHNGKILVTDRAVAV